MNIVKEINDEKSFIQALGNDYDEMILNTFRYIFYKFQKGNFIRIRNGKVLMIEFKNLKYRNEWGNILMKENKFKNQQAIDEFIKYSSLFTRYWNKKQKFGEKLTFNEFFEKKSKFFNYKYLNRDINTWYANDCLIRFDLNEKPNDSYREMLLDLFERCKNIKSADFFVNKRDFPILKKNKTEAYSAIFGVDKPLISHNYKKYSKIFSFCTAKEFKDIVIPNFEDWEIDSTNFNLNFSSKKHKILFRGSTTGCGTSPKTNPRLRILEYSKNKEIFDVGITKWNLRPKVCNGKISFIKGPYTKIVPKMPFSEQSNYKFILHLPGNVEAFRLSNELSMNSCIIMLETKWKLWFSKLIKPYVHYIPLKEDFSNFGEILSFIENNEKRCEKIAKNAYNLSKKIFCKEYMVDFTEKLLF